MKLSYNMVNLDYNERMAIRVLIKKEVETLMNLIDESDDKMFIENYREELEHLEGIFNKLAY